MPQMPKADLRACLLLRHNELYLQPPTSAAALLPRIVRSASLRL
jgi:hypothetical protein